MRLGSETNPPKPAYVKSSFILDHYPSVIQLVIRNNRNSIFVPWKNFAKQARNFIANPKFRRYENTFSISGVKIVRKLSTEMKDRADVGVVGGVADGSCSNPKMKEE